MKPTYEQVASLLDYNPETGKLTWKVNRRGSAMAGCEAGYVEVHTKKPTYLRVTIFDKRYQAHHIAVLLMTGEWPKVVDHDDRDGLNNRWNNLVVTDTQGNNRNRGFAPNSAGHVGVYHSKTPGKYYAMINTGTKDGKRYLGTFDSFEAAVKAREDAQDILGYHPNHGTKI
ncbi:HNH endonuclease [Pectobacterium phage vB_PatP_CB3]|uniref:HNH endonuclease n=2 Tax=Cbunavirus CB4 TaxID=2845777 RepID=A0A2P9J4Y6_9CAUD|nr:HNH endonuclease [Pectobacterium phage vB_PatP_CB4]AQT27897.1 HNH endonuclease [Pectobacterium phage vB_PatP_CB4]ARB11880.1 HNH endonuclease [Pectobacterium phage vB_PatP_CB3]